MSKERLEEIKQQFRWGLANLYRGRDNLDDADIEYLFQQAEEKIQLEERVKSLIHENTEIRKGYRERSKRVKELEKEVKHWKSCTDSEQKIAGRLQNKVNSLEKQNNELTGIGGMWMSARNKLEESQKLNQRYKQALEEIVKEGTLKNFATGKLGYKNGAKIARQALQGGNDNE